MKVRVVKPSSDCDHCHDECSEDELHVLPDEIWHGPYLCYPCMKAYAATKQPSQRLCDA